MHGTDLRFYRYNSKWTRSVQDAVLTVLLHGWLGGALVPEGKVGRLLTLEEVGEHVFHGQLSHRSLSIPVQTSFKLTPRSQCL